MKIVAASDIKTITQEQHDDGWLDVELFPQKHLKMHLLSIEQVFQFTLKAIHCNEVKQKNKRGRNEKKKKTI